MSSFTTKTVSTLAASVLAAGLTTPAWGQASCPQTSATVTHNGATLEGFATTNNSGVIYDNLANDLELQSQAGVVSNELSFTPTYQAQVGCAADFNSDTWPDFVGATPAGDKLGFWRNDTKDNYDADVLGGLVNWNDPAYHTTPKFTWVGWFETPPVALQGAGGSAIGCGDFNADGHADFFLVEEAGGTGATPYRADMFLGHGDGTFDPAYPITADLTQYNGLRKDSTPYVVDYNGDGKLDFLLPTLNPSSLGRVQVFLNDGTASPTFAPGAILVDDIAVGGYGATGVTSVDFNRDGVADLAVTGIAFRGVLLFYGLSGGGYDPPLTITDTRWPSGPDLGAQVVVGGDFDLDGYNDLMIGTNKGGGHLFVWKDDGAPDYITNHQADFDLTHTFTDTDLGFAMDYDNDPQHTTDFVLGDYNGGTYTGAGFFAFANRLFDQYVSCAELASDVLDLGVLQGQSMVITAARLDPSEIEPNSTTITWSMSNEEPPNWQPANPCVDDSTKLCVSFPQPAGQAVRWRAQLCSSPAHDVTPSVSQVQIKFDYELAATHYRAGVVTNHGVAYIGGFEQPGDTGHFYATNARVETLYWDAGAKLDAMSDSNRNVYTATSDGKTIIPFDTAAAATPELQDTLGVATTQEASDLVTWQRSARFGITATSRLGSILTSTAAVLGPPQRPYYYGQVSPTEKAKIDAFITAHHDRPTLILFGSKDGALHAVRNDVANITAPTNGDEAWAFIPPRIAHGFLQDKTSATTDNYPDGSPTLADVKIGTAYRTIAIVGSGNGGKSFAALDVTDTVASGGSVTGPTALWDYVPGGGSAGQSASKASVIRVKISGTERFLAVLATGVGYDNMLPPYAKGLDVEAVDVTTGVRAWRFRAACPVSTDTIGFETDDELEPGAPSIDGFVDRVMFADVCGNVYKLFPGQEHLGVNPDEGWIAGLGSIDTGVIDPGANHVTALFSTTATVGALGEERPIAGTIGARPDTTGRLALFFGTGGVESFDSTKANAFYSIYADTGEIRDSVLGTCTGPNSTCEKFYGGVIVTPDQVLITRAIDPPIATASCDNGSADIVGLDISDLEQQFVITSSSSMVSSLYGDGGAIYATTLAGAVVRVGTPAQPDATPDEPPGQTQNGAGTEPVKRRSWRELLY